MRALRVNPKRKRGSTTMAAPLPGAMLDAMSSVQFTTQVVYVAVIALAMISTGLSKRRLEWKRRPPRRRKGGRRERLHRG
jgi:hypothetical protein